MLTFNSSNVLSYLFTIYRFGQNCSEKILLVIYASMKAHVFFVVVFVCVFFFSIKHQVLT